MTSEPAQARVLDNSRLTSCPASPRLARWARGLAPRTSLSPQQRGVGVTAPSPRVRQAGPVPGPDDPASAGGPCSIFSSPRAAQGFPMARCPAQLPVRMRKQQGRQEPGERRGCYSGSVSGALRRAPWRQKGEQRTPLRCQRP